MAASSIDAIQKNPKYQQLVAERSALGRSLSIAMMVIAHGMRQTRRVGDEERGHWLMSLLPNAPPLSLRGTFAPVRGKLH